MPVETAAPAATEVQSSAPVAAVSAPVTETPQSTPAQGTPQTPAAPEIPAQLSPDSFDSLQDYADALVNQRQEQKTAEQKTEAAPEVTPATEEVKTPEQIVPDGEQKTEEVKTEENTAPKEGELDLDELLTTKGLSEQITADPQLKAALEANPALKGALYRNARLAEEADKFRELFPDVESAKIAASNGAAWSDFDNAFEVAADPKGVDSFMDMWAENAVLRDQQGKPVMDNGVPRFHPAFHNIMQRVRDDSFAQMRKIAEQQGDQEALDALNTLRERIAGSSHPSEEELPEHIKAAAENIKRRETELNRQQLEQQTAEQQRVDAEVGKDSTSRIDALINPALDKAALSDFVRQTAKDKIDNAIMESLNKNKFFQSRMAELARYPATPETKQQRLNVIMQHVQAVAGPIVRQVLREAAAPVMKAQEERKAKVETQVAASRSNVAGARSAASPAAVKSPEVLFNEIKDKYIGEHGEEPPVQKLLELWAVAKRGGQ